jgi:hypothetical protein
MPFYRHTRFEHQLIAGLIAALVLARNGFSYAERTPVVLTVMSHDIAMPAGGDSIKRIDSAAFDEETNYANMIRASGLASLWQKKCGFDIDQAASWVKGRGTMGFLLDICDKISYTLLDCFHISLADSNLISDYCSRYPFIGDLWQDIRFTPDRQKIYFEDPERLYRFLYLRGLEHRDVLWNPRCRAFDFFMTTYAGELYKKGIITRQDLLTKDDGWLFWVLKRNYPDIWQACQTPDIFCSRKFADRKKFERYCQLIGAERIDHFEHIKPFKTGLDWPVRIGAEIKPLMDAIDRNAAKNLAQMASKVSGHAIYIRKEDSY